MVFARLVKVATFGVAATLALTLGIAGSMAADTKKPAAPAAPAAAPAAPGAAGQAADSGIKPEWYKLCFDVAVPEAPKEGEKPKQQKPEDMKKAKLCLTQFDVRDNVIGMVRSKLAVRQIEGAEKPQLLVMLPLGSSLPLGAWVKIDDKEPPVKLAYQTCDQLGCYAEAPIETALVDQMKTGKQIAYLGIDVTGHALSIPLPLDGFAKAFDGQPIPMDKFTEDQKKIADFIRARVADLRKKQEEEAAKGGGAAPQGAPAATPADKKSK